MSCTRAGGNSRRLACSVAPVTAGASAKRVEEQRRALERLDRERERIEERRRLNRERMRELVPHESRPERGLGRERELERTPERNLLRGIEL